MARLNSIDDTEWTEVTKINNYSVFMGYLLTGVRGLSFLVVTWTTVVLLGGFVSLLQKKDFWSLTVSTLIQTAGVFDFILKEKLRDAVSGAWGMLVVLSATINRLNKGKKESIARTVLTLTLEFCLLVFQLLVFAIVSCPLASLYVLGPYISAGISLWRLIEHDYGNADEGANLKPALNVLYSLAVAQGVLFGYRVSYGFGARIGVAKLVADRYGLDLEIVADYLDETIRGCEKDPLFARGRNLITYAVDLMTESKLHDSYLSGVRVLGTFIRWSELNISGRPVLIKQLLTGSATFVCTIQKLLETLGPRSPYSSEIRGHAARIVAHVARDIHLGNFPGGVHYVSSLVDTFEEYCWQPSGYFRKGYLPEKYERDWLLQKYEQKYLTMDPVTTVSSMPPRSERDLLSGYEELVLQGLHILRELAVDVDNCRVMSNADGLLAEATASLISDRLHRDHHAEWYRMAIQSVELITRLISAPGETGTKLRRQVSGNTRAISTLKSILKCGECKRSNLQGLAVEILLDLSVDTSSIMSSGDSRTIFIDTLLKNFLPDSTDEDPFERLFIYHTGEDQWISRCYFYSIRWMKRRRYIRGLAGEKLVTVISLQGEDDATAVLKGGYGSVAADLTGTLAAFSFSKRTDITIASILAAEILDHLCSHYTKDDEYLKELKKGMTKWMPQVIRKVLSCESTGQEIQAETEANKARCSAPAIDLEKGHDSLDSSQGNPYSSHQQNIEQHEDIKLQEALISLCETICKRWIKADPDLARQFDEIAAKICSEEGKPVRSFTSLVKEAQELLKKKE